MKKLLLLIAIITTISCTAQKNSTTEKTIDVPADSVAFVSAKDMEAFIKWLPENLTKAQYDNVKPEDAIIMFYKWAVLEWQKKKKAKK